MHFYPDPSSITFLLLRQDDTANSLKIDNIVGLFYILLVGLILAVIVAALEFLYKSQVEARRRNVRRACSPTEPSSIK